MSYSEFHIPIKGKIVPVRGKKGKMAELRYSSTISLNSAVDDE
jgi:hypothetical protein